MRVAVISDIHGNCVALDSALAEIRKMSVDQIVCLGDTVQGGPQPSETLDRLRALKCPMVMGNSDAWLLDEASMSEPTTIEHRTVREWTLAKLSENDLTFIRQFQLTVQIELGDGQSLFCFHGSPSSYDDLLLRETPNEQWDRLLGQYSPAIMAGGNMHTQQLRHIRESLFFNPGSVGVVYDHIPPDKNARTKPWAEYAILSCDSTHFVIEFRRAYYDLEQLIQVIKRSGRPNGEKMINQYKHQRSVGD